MFCSIPGDIRQTALDGQIPQRLKFQPENTVIVCRDRDFCRYRRRLRILSPWGKQGNCLIRITSLALIHWPVLLCWSVVWAKPAWEELRGMDCTRSIKEAEKETAPLKNPTKSSSESNLVWQRWCFSHWLTDKNTSVTSHLMSEMQQLCLTELPPCSIISLPQAAI